MRGFFVTTHFRRYLLAGLLVWIPIMVTLLVVRFVVQLLDSSLSLLPAKYQPDVLLGWHMPGLGVVISLLVLLITGLVATNVIGHRLVSLGDSLVNRIPLIRSIYTSVKQVMHTLFAPGGQAFRKVLLVEYPRTGIWSLAFQTGAVPDAMKKAIGEDAVTLFIPTTPNPTSGFLLVLPQDQVIELDMSVDDALKMIISLGVVQPPNAVATPVVPTA
jgi:uncharacterized membrane protein